MNDEEAGPLTRSFHKACLPSTAFDDSAWNDVTGDLGGRNVDKKRRRVGKAHTPDASAVVAASPSKARRPPKEDEAPAWHCPFCVASHVLECVVCGDPGDAETRLVPCMACPRAYHSRCAEREALLEYAPGTSQFRCVACAPEESDDESDDDPSPEAEASARPKKKMAPTTTTVGQRLETEILTQIADLCKWLPRRHFASILGSRIERVVDLARAPALEGRKKSRPAILAAAALDSALDPAEVVSRLTYARKSGGEDEATTKRRDFGRRPDHLAMLPNNQRLTRISTAAADFDRGGSKEDRRRQLDLEGVCCFPNALTADQVTAMRGACLGHYEDVMHTVAQLGLVDHLFEGGGFSTFKTRDRGRFDVVVPDLVRGHTFAWLRNTHTSAPWMALVRDVLGPSARLAHCGCILAMPSAAAQKWHSDGDHVLDDLQLKPHALNVFLPLVDVTAHNGATEFVPATHLDWHMRRRPLVIDATAGDALVFDWRLKHRGLANMSTAPRPMVYLTYALPWFVDRYNFSTDRYADLPALVPRSSRDDRRKKGATRDNEAAATTEDATD